jgi:hypothetical protein
VKLKHAWSDALWIKRVIGLPGDLVAPGPKGSVFVNGKPFHPPEITCGHFISVKMSSDDSAPMFKATKVPRARSSLSATISTRVSTAGSRSWSGNARDAARKTSLFLLVSGSFAHRAQNLLITAMLVACRCCSCVCRGFRELESGNDQPDETEPPGERNQEAGLWNDHAEPT